MSKYIIEIPDNTRRIWIDVFGEGYCYTRAENVDDLEELNSDYINENFGELQDEAYQAGLNDAWEAAKKIFGYEIDGAIPIADIGNVFGYEPCKAFCTADILRDFTVQEAITKLKDYEDGKQKDRIEVGDEVTHKSDSAVWKAVCIRIVGDRQHMTLMGYTGAVGYYPVDDFKKTGKHYDIQSILEAMRK